jgi:O-antigen ligase
MLTSTDLTRLLGVSWGLLPLTYLFPGGHFILYGLHVVLYAVIMLVGRKNKIPQASASLIFICFIFLILSLSQDSYGNFNKMNYAALLLFTMNLACLIVLVDRNVIQQFSSNFFLATAFCAVFYIVLVHLGKVPDHYGRLYFIGDEHPNLAGEIFGIAAFAGAISMQKKSFLIACFPMIYATFIMETRTGTVVIGLTIIAKILLESKGKISKRSLVNGCLVSLLILGFAMLEGTLIRLIATEVLLSEDANRGASSGFVSGRDSQWRAAWSFFTERPWFGWGMGLYSEGVRGAHNPLLYSLSMFGIFGLLFWLWLGVGFLRIVQKDIRIFILLVPVSLMIVLNDRFMNSNSFPLLYYLFIIQLGRFAPNQWEMAELTALPKVKFPKIILRKKNL